MDDQPPKKLDDSDTTSDRVENIEIADEMQAAEPLVPTEDKDCLDESKKPEPDLGATITTQEIDSDDLKQIFAQCLTEAQAPALIQPSGAVESSGANSVRAMLPSAPISANAQLHSDFVLTLSEGIQVHQGKNKQGPLRKVFPATVLVAERVKPHPKVTPKPHRIMTPLPPLSSARSPS
jgi:hypothetical protein